MDLTEVSALVRRWFRTIVVASIIAAVCGYFISRLQEPTYVAETQLLVGPVSGDLDDIRAASNLTETYAELVLRTPLLASAAQRAEIALPTKQIRELTRVRANELTRIITISVSQRSPDIAANLADALASELVDQAGLVKVIEPAGVPIQSDSANTAVVVPLAAFAGLACALAFAFVHESVKAPVRTQSDVEDASGAGFFPVTGMRSRFRRERAGAAQKSYDLMAAALDQPSRAEQARTLLVCPSKTERSAPETAMRLSASLAALGRNVVLVDADGSRTLSRMLRLENSPGWSDMFRPGAETADRPAARDLLRISSIPGLSILPAGSMSWVMGREDSFTVIEELLHDADRVVIAADSPLVDAPSLRWAASADATVLVATAERTSKRELQDAARALRSVGAALAGTVLHSRR